MYFCKQILLLSFSIFLLCQVLHSLRSESTESCLYPPGSIVCKIWNHTNLDCTWRDLTCIPPISVEHKDSLQLLDLKFNKLNVLPENAFSGLWKLQTLDLSCNFISTFHKYTFAGPDSLQTLKLRSNNISSIPDNAFCGLDSLTNLDLAFNSVMFLGDNSFTHLHSLISLDLSQNGITFLCNSTFKGLNNLRSLDLHGNSLNNIPPSPFHDLVSLQTLYVGMYDIVISPVLFVGLDHLIFLSIQASDFTTDTPFHQLSSLRHLKLVMDTCSFAESLFTRLRKLEFLEIHVDSVETCPDINFGQLISLTNLSFSKWYAGATIPSLKSLETLDAPLQSLSISFSNTENIILNSTTFELWAKWKLNLQVFKIQIGEYGMLKIEGSPFQWFPNLTGLYIFGYLESDITLQILSKKAFEGLGNLEILWFNCLQTNILTSGALTIFSEYNSLKTLNLARNHLDDYNKLDQICNLLSIKLIDLSYNDNDRFTDLNCTLPNLSDLNIKNDKILNKSFLDKIFQKAPNLKTLNVDNHWWYLFTKNVTFSKLVTLQSSHSFIEIDDTYNVLAPCLKELYLSNIILSGVQIKNLKILYIFKAPQLRMVDMSNNHISIIDKKDGRLFSNLKFLDLHNNQLTSPAIINLQHLQNIKVLLLGSNKITAIPKPLLQTLTAVDTLDFCNNVLRCDCSVEAFRKWILADEFVFLINDCFKFNPERNPYKCFSPDSQKGVSVTQIDLDCESHLFRYISIGVACLVFVIIIVTVVGHYRWHIQYRLFLLFNRGNFQHILNNDDVIDNNDIGDENGLPRYDAYVTYHRDDEDWVDGELLPNVEECEEPFRLGLRTRDIRAGRLIFNELSLHIQRSRKILVILTPRFVEDNWCYFELNMAHHRVLEENSKVLIFILLEKIPDDEMTLLLRQLFCRALCLKWPGDGYGQYLFWQRLREELKRPVPLDRRFYI